MISAEIDQIKRHAIVALFSIDELVDTLVLKGGNALRLAHNLRTRASFDLDFSMEGQFELSELPSLRSRIEFRLAQVMSTSGYKVFDVTLEPKPEPLSAELADFWGGYDLEFKLIRQDHFLRLHENIDQARKEAIPARPGGRARFEIDISRHEYCTGKQKIEIDHLTVYVYTPMMIVCEKIRAICQQHPDYVQIVKKHRATRARDFFDIHQTVRRFKLDSLSDESLDLLQKIFDAKRVPLSLLEQVDSQRTFHETAWNEVVNTVDPTIKRRDFDYYFDYVATLCRSISTALT